jgi:hypothetical protein
MTLWGIVVILSVVAPHVARKQKHFKFVVLVKTIELSKEEFMSVVEAIDMNKKVGNCC